MEKKDVNHKCECPEKGMVSKDRECLYSKEEKSGMNHAPGKCKGTHDVRLYSRDGVKLWLCSCCTLPWHKEVK